jgi:hypothetical protein
VDVDGGTLEGFWSMITGEAHWQRNSIRNPSSKCFTHGCAKGFWGEWETKITNTELNWLYLAFCQAANRLHLPYDQPVVLWSNIRVGRYGSGCYLSMLAISLWPGIPRNPEHLLAGTSLGLQEAR